MLTCVYVHKCVLTCVHVHKCVLTYVHVNKCMLTCVHVFCVLVPMGYVCMLTHWQSAYECRNYEGTKANTALWIEMANGFLCISVTISNE